ncbi:hypothetical protein B6V74_08375 [Thioclava sp. F42-5]|uniref:hypothetical protein n=1 Tax=Thioclava sp. F42-5 TaxID=1973005 RepID=UPI000B547A16|nr:hypothetical protein [Thioclava sp. F42-5]OWY10010.1 hypothetical protein B6V74_08375 [Thioclava sp. F42-5]
MADTLERLHERLSALEDEIEAEWDRRREAMAFRLDHNRVVFEAGVRDAHRQARVGLLRFLSYARPMVILTAPVIYSLIVPFVLLDLFVSLYQAICFPIYRIAKVKRSDHIVVDRQHLAYLNALQKLNCVYCGYCNGLLSYVREIAGRTEQYWCPIKHAHQVKGPHLRYRDFVEYTDAEGFQAQTMRLRRALREMEE